MTTSRTPNLAMNPRRTVSLVVFGSVALIVAFAPRSKASAAPVAMVPAQYNNERQDANGFGWQISPNGLNSDNRGCISHAAALHIGGSQAHFQQGQMSPDGLLFQQSGVKMMNLDISRRVRFDFANSNVQFVDSFSNKTNSPISVSVTISARLGNPAQAVVSDQARPLGGGSLGAQDSGLLAVAQNNGMPSAMFYFGTPKARVRPTVNVQNNYQLNANYSISVGAGKTVSIVTGIGQLNLNGPPDATATKNAFKPLMSPSWIRSVPKDVRGTIANAIVSSAGMLDDSDSIDALAELGDRGPHDMLLVGSATRLRGTLSGGQISIDAKRGRREVALDRVAAIFGGNQSGRPAKLVLRDGQVLVGPVKVPEFKFTLNSGLDVSCSVDSVDRLVLKEAPADGKPAPEVFAYIDLLEGDRLAVKQGEPQKITIVTAWGACDIALEEIDLFTAGNPSHGTITHRLALRDGSVFSTMVSDGDLKLNSSEYGTQNWSVFDIRRLRAAHRTPATDGAEPAAPHVVLTGDNLFVGQVELPLIHLVVQGQTIPLQPGSLKSLKRETAAGSSSLAEEKSVYVAELWDGDTATGELRESTLPLRTVGGILQVPVTDLVELRTPSPTVPESLRTRITELLADLGHVDYNRREAATKELQSLGEVVKEQGADALKATTDPEVRKRLQTLLDGLKE